MKKRFLVTVMLVISVICSVLAFTACNNDPAHKCDSVCSECGKCTSDCTDEACKDKCEGHQQASVNMTEGVYNCLMGSYDLLIKFYDEETYYLQNETTGYRGKYEIKDESITFARTQPDGSDYNSADHPNDARWITGNKTIYFYQEDGTTPIAYALNKSEASVHSDTIVTGTCYAYGTKPHTLAYNTETDQIQSFKGNYGSRTLSHTKLRNFTINDEKAIEQAKFMVKTLPDGAEAGKVESDYFLTLSQKGYETNIPALAAWELTNGKFTKSGDVYTLTDTISGVTATLTVTANGATVTKGDDMVELVVWADVTPYAVEVSGSALGGKIQAKVRFNEDGTLTIFGSTKNYNGKYKANKDGTITVSNVDADSPVAITSASFASEGEVITLTAQLSISTGNAQMPTATATATGTVTGKLFGLEAVVLLEVESNEAVFGTMKMKLEMKDDCSLVVSVGGQSKVTAYWTLTVPAQGAPSMTFKKSSAGTFAFAFASQTTGKITWTGKLSDTEATDSTYTFEFALLKLSALQSAKVAEKHVVNGEDWNSRATKIVFYADGTLEVNVGGSAIATADWTFAMNGTTPSVTIANCSNGTVTTSWGSGDTQGKYVFTWTGKVSPQMPNNTTLTFAMPTAELANLR